LVECIEPVVVALLALPLGDPPAAGNKFFRLDLGSEVLGEREMLLRRRGVERQRAATGAACR
jgi:hypothetical protein